MLYHTLYTVLWWKLFIKDPLNKKTLSIKDTCSGCLTSELSTPSYRGTYRRPNGVYAEVPLYTCVGMSL